MPIVIRNAGRIRHWKYRGIFDDDVQPNWNMDGWYWWSICSPNNRRTGGTPFQSSCAMLLERCHWCGEFQWNDDHGNGWVDTWQLNFMDPRCIIAEGVIFWAWNIVVIVHSVDVKCKWRWFCDHKLIICIQSSSSNLIFTTAILAITPLNCVRLIKRNAIFHCLQISQLMIYWARKSTAYSLVSSKIISKILPGVQWLWWEHRLCSYLHVAT